MHTPALCRLPLPEPLMRGQFVKRLNRFAVTAEGPDGELYLHLPNSGRMTELLVPGTAIAYHPRDKSHRRTDGDMILVKHGGRWVSVDSRLPNKVFHRCFTAGVLTPFHLYDCARTEVPLDGGRIDFLLTGGGGRCYVETKSCNLVEEGAAMFPDAPTARGTRHLQSLMKVAGEGHGAAVVFIVQRDDPRVFRPHWEADPVFSGTLARAAAAGVQVLAYRCRVTEQSIEVLGTIPIDLERKDTADRISGGGEAEVGPC